MEQQNIKKTESRIRKPLLVAAAGVAVVISFGGAFVYHPDRLANFFLFAAAPGGIPASIVGLLMGYGHGPPPMVQFLLSLPFNILVYAILLAALEKLARAAFRKRHRSDFRT